jgi:hypothetical protein
MICAIMQPTFMPWIGYFDLIDSVDCFVFYDDVQLVRSSWQVRNRIKTPNGELMLTIPVLKTARRDDLLISDAFIDYSFNWVEKYLKSITNSYRKAIFFDELFNLLYDLFHKKYEKLADLNIDVITALSNKMNLKVEFKRSSELIGIEGIKDQRLVNVCKLLNSNRYLSPIGSSVYIEKESEAGEFMKSGINLFYQNYTHPEYKQLYGEFLPYMSIVDLIANEGFEGAVKIIRSGRTEYLTSKNLE